MKHNLVNRKLILGRMPLLLAGSGVFLLGISAFLHTTVAFGQQMMRVQGETFSPLIQQSITVPPRPVFKMGVVDLAPGTSVPAHKHPGQVFAYVLEGQLVTQIQGSAQTTLSAGQTYSVPSGTVQELYRNPSTTQHTRILSVQIASAGQPLEIPAAPTSTR